MYMIFNLEDLRRKAKKINTQFIYQFFFYQQFVIFTLHIYKLYIFCSNSFF